MTRQFRRIGALGFTATLFLATAAAAMGYLTTNTKSFDSRTFEYGGHVSYSFQVLGLTRTLNLLTHNNSNCGSGQCGSDPHYLRKCRITDGSQSYTHTLVAKILKNGAVVDERTTNCYHDDSAWEYWTGYFLNAPYPGSPTDAWKFRITIEDAGGTAQDSNDVSL